MLEIRNLSSALSLSGDPVHSELLHHNRIYQFKEKLSTTPGIIELADNWPKIIPETIVPLQQGFPYDATTYHTGDMGREVLTRDVKIGDVNGNLRDDIVFLRKSSESSDLMTPAVDPGFYIVRLELDLSQSGDGIFDATVEQLDRESLYTAMNGSPRLALPNVDNDSISVQLKSHEVTFGDNALVAVLAAPPCASGINQNTDACATRFGQGTSESWTNGSYLNTKLGIIFGTEVQVDGTAALGLGLAVSIGKWDNYWNAGLEFSVTQLWTNTVEETITYSAGASGNLVIFDTHVYDKYLYEIITAPDLSSVGTTLSVSIPTGKNRMAVSTTYYNAHNGEQPDIDDTVLAIIPGDISSYPSLLEATAILEGRTVLTEFPAATNLPPLGLNFETEYGYSVTNGYSSEISVGGFLDMSQTVCILFACGGVMTDLSIGITHGYEWENGLIFELTLGGIAEEDYAENAHDIGLFAYQHNMGEAGKEQSFIVVNYYIVP